MPPWTLTLVFLVLLGILQGMVKTGLVPATLTAMQSESFMSDLNVWFIELAYDATFFVMAFIFCVKNPPLLLMPIALGGFCVGIGAFFFAVSNAAWMLFFGMVLIGVGSTPLWVLTPCYLETLLVEPQLVRRGMGAMYAGNPFGIAVGFIIGGNAAASGHWRVPFTIATVLIVPVSIVLVFLAYKEIQRTRYNALSPQGVVLAVEQRKKLAVWKIVTSDRVFMALALGSASSGLALSGLSVFLPKFFENVYTLSEDTAALYVVLCVMTGAVLGNGIGGFITSHFKLNMKQELLFSFMATTLTAMSGGPVFVSPSVGFMIPMFSLTMFIAFVPSPAVMAVLVSLCKTPETKAVGMSFTNLVFRIFGWIGPMMMSAMVDGFFFSIMPFIVILATGFGLNTIGVYIAYRLCSNSKTLAKENSLEGGGTVDTGIEMREDKAKIIALYHQGKIMV